MDRARLGARRRPRRRRARLARPAEPAHHDRRARPQRSRRSASRCCSTSRSATSAARPRTATSRRACWSRPIASGARTARGTRFLPRAPAQPRSRRPARHRLGRPARADAGRPRRQAADRRRQRRSRRNTWCASRRAAAGAAGRALALLRHGLELDGEALRPARGRMGQRRPAALRPAGGQEAPDPAHVRAVGLQVLGLKRVRIGAVMLGELPTGQWRYLRADESF